MLFDLRYTTFVLRYTVAICQVDSFSSALPSYRSFHVSFTARLAGQYTKFLIAARTAEAAVLLHAAHFRGSFQRIQHWTLSRNLLILRKGVVLMGYMFWKDILKNILNFPQISMMTRQRTFRYHHCKLYLCKCCKLPSLFINNKECLAQPSSLNTHPKHRIVASAPHIKHTFQHLRG